MTLKQHWREIERENELLGEYTGDNPAMTKKSQSNRNQERKRKTVNLDRSFTFDRSAVNEEERTVELAFSLRGAVRKMVRHGNTCP